jgi:small subunit ribosomal protein S4
MARITSPVCRLCRRAGEKLFLKGDRCLTPKCAIEKRNAPPGQRAARRRRISEYGVRLKEKQKAKWIYGVLEHQFERYFEEATRRPGATGTTLLELLERRLDNVVFRLGLADSRSQARQLVTHGHVMVNGRVRNVASSLVRPGDVIGWKATSAKTQYAQERLPELGKRSVPGWLALDPQTATGKVVSLPQPSDIDTGIDHRLIVELYSR